MSGFEELGREFWRIWKEEGIEMLLASYESFFTEDAVWSPPIAQVEGKDYVGHDGFARYVADFHDTFKSFGGQIIPGSTHDLEGGISWSEVHVSAELHEGGHLDATLIALARLRDGRMTYAFGTYDPEAAERKLDELRAEARHA